MTVGGNLRVNHNTSIYGINTVTLHLTYNVFLQISSASTLKKTVLTLPLTVLQHSTARRSPHLSWLRPNPCLRYCFVYQSLDCVNIYYYMHWNIFSITFINTFRLFLLKNVLVTVNFFFYNRTFIIVISSYKQLSIVDFAFSPHFTLGWWQDYSHSRCRCLFHRVCAFRC